MGPTYLVLLRQGADSIAILLYVGKDETEARAAFDKGRRDANGALVESDHTVYLTTVRAEAKLS